MNLPTFPAFDKLTLAHKPIFDDLILRHAESADYKFPSLWSYNTNDDALVSSLNDNVVIQFRDYITNDPFLSFFGFNKITETAQALLAESKLKGFVQELKLIPEDVIAAEPDLSTKLAISEDRGSFDYILSLQEIAKLEGTKFKNHRNHVNRFYKNYPEAIVRELDMAKQSDRDEILELFDRWVTGRGKTVEETQHEKIAITRLIECFETFKLFVLGLYVDGKIISFNINDLDIPKMVQNHFAKSDVNFVEAYYILNQEVGKRLVAKGYEFINIENDLDIPGLRYSKEQWNPVRYIKKYIIAPR